MDLFVPFPLSKTDLSERNTKKKQTFLFSFVREEFCLSIWYSFTIVALVDSFFLFFGSINAKLKILFNFSVLLIKFAQVDLMNFFRKPYLHEKPATRENEKKNGQIIPI